MKRCRHPKRWAMTSWIAVQKYSIGDTWHIHVEALRCRGCGELLGMEPASDTPDVLVEIRAAELALTPLDEITVGSATAVADGAEIAGWIDHAFDSAKVPDQPGEWSGWLAREILRGGE